jgi:hypothetical protein
VARQHGCWRADHYRIGSENGLVEHISNGYRKWTTGEYVPNAYLANFGWKNTYYQCAITTVSISADYAAQRLWGVAEVGTMAALV